MFDRVPDGDVDVLVGELLPPDDGTVAEQHVEVVDGPGFIPGGDAGCMINPVQEVFCGNGVLGGHTEEQGYLGGLADTFVRGECGLHDEAEKSLSKSKISF